jgi:hypothetical protein
MTRRELVGASAEWLADVFAADPARASGRPLGDAVLICRS